jgi:hypothetical protein
MKKNQFGVWEITISHKPPGEAAIPHDSKIKVGSSTSMLCGDDTYVLYTISDIYDTSQR